MQRTLVLTIALLALGIEIGIPRMELKLNVASSVVRGKGLLVELALDHLLSATC